jgi:predicted dehydrogenase
MSSHPNSTRPQPPSISRRAFLAASTVSTASLAGGVLLAPYAALGANGPSKAAVIGHTGRGDYGHGIDEVFQNRSGIELVAVADAHPDGLRRAVERLKPARSYASYREMLERERPGLVSVAPRHADQHRDMVLAALQVGAHVYCEKPFTTTPAEADELLAEAARRQLKIAIAHQMRLAPAILRLKAAVAEGLLGRLVELRGYGKQDARAGGEDMMVLGTHLFDLMRLFAGDPVSCRARVLWQQRDITRADARMVSDNIGPVAGDEVMAEFAFPGGVHATFTSRAALRDTIGAWGLELIGSKGVARINANIPPRIFLKKSDGWNQDGRSDSWQPFAADAEAAGGGAPINVANGRIVQDWLGAITAGREPAGSARHGAWAVEMVMGVYEAALSAQRISFPLKRRTHPLA